MNQYEFYSNFFKYRGNKEDVQHASTYGDYYHKIENYYGPGKSRYFDTKEEYDAYLKEQQKMYDKAVEEQNQNKIKKFTSGREAAIKNSNNNYNDITANNLRFKYEGNAAKDRAEKEKEVAAKKATSTNDYTRKRGLEKAQSGREAAIKNSYRVPDDEFEKIVAKDKEYLAEQEKIKNNVVYAAMKNLQKKINRAEKMQEQQKNRQSAIDNSEKISDEEWKKRLKDDEDYQKLAKLPGGKAMADAIVKKKTLLNNPPEENNNVEEDVVVEENSNKKTVKDLYNETKEAAAKEEAARKELRKIQLEKLNDNFNEFKSILRKLANDYVSLTRSQLYAIKKNPLYIALNESLSNGDSSYDIIDYIDVGGKKGELRIMEMEKNLEDLVSTLEKNINNGITSSKAASTEKPKPSRSAI